MRSIGKDLARCKFNLLQVSTLPEAEETRREKRERVFGANTNYCAKRPTVH
jgi:hypothetical protein